MVFCALVGAAILGVGAGFQFSNLWIGLAAAAFGAGIGWFFGRHISPLDAFFPPFGGLS